MPTALIVEDEAVIALDLASELQSLGFDVLGLAKTREHALEIVARTVPDLAIVDVILNGAAQGLSIAEDLRARGVKVLLVSGSIDLPAQGVRVVLSKPWTRDDLVREVGLLTAAAV
jgi:two-component system, response regulator PdtaR